MYFLAPNAFGDLHFDFNPPATVIVSICVCVNLAQSLSPDWSCCRLFGRSNFPCRRHVISCSLAARSQRGNRVTHTHTGSLMCICMCVSVCMCEFVLDDTLKQFTYLLPFADVIAGKKCCLCKMKPKLNIDLARSAVMAAWLHGRMS